MATTTVLAKLVVVLGILGFSISGYGADDCDLTAPVVLQILGAGGPELDDRRNSTGYLLWHRGRAAVLIDMGPGASAEFERSGARFNDLHAVLFSHFHVDHSAGFPALVKGGYFSRRTRDLPVFGPSGNALLPSTTQFLERLFGLEGVYPYLNDYLKPHAESGSYQLNAKVVDIAMDASAAYAINDEISVSASPVHHGPLPALAWRIDIGDYSVTFTGDTNNSTGGLNRLASRTGMLVAHNAIPEAAGAAARNLHMTPAQIADLVEIANPTMVVLSHRMNRTLGDEDKTLTQIGKVFEGTMAIAEDGRCFSVPPEGA